MKENELLKKAVLQLFDSCTPETFTHHLNKATADMVKVNDFDNKIDRSNSVYHNSQLINFIHKVHSIIKDEPKPPSLETPQLN